MTRSKWRMVGAAIAVSAYRTCKSEVTVVTAGQTRVCVSSAGVVRVAFERTLSSSGVMTRSCRNRITRFHAASNFFQPDAWAKCFTLRRGS